MNRFWLVGDLLFPEGHIAPGALLIDGNRIGAVSSAPAADGLPVIQQPDGAVLLPGFIDLQINGGWGHDFTQEPESVLVVAEHLPATGVTAFLPTVVTASWERYPAILANLNATIAESWKRTDVARPLGGHIEGPFLSPRKPGAHNPTHLRLPTVADAQALLQAGSVKLLTLAPELDGALEVISALSAAGIVVSAGHSMATWEQAQAGFAAGIRYGTHLFNAMPPLHHRDPGLVGALLNRADVPVGLMLDGVHIHPEVVRMVYRLKGAAGITLITDAIAALGMPPGRYQLSDRTIIVNRTSARLSDGTLAGSIMTMDQAVRNMVAFTGCSLAEAAIMAAQTPARLLRIEDRQGVLRPGADADIVVLDAHLEVWMTLIGGQIVYAQQRPAL